MVAQNATLGIWNEYRLTGSTEKRIATVTAEREHETLPSRIFKWFWLWARRGVTSEDRDLAWRCSWKIPSYRS
jgi:hypothetical protein